MVSSIRKSPWYRKNWHPWGQTIWWHDEMFLHVAGRPGAQCIKKHYCHKRETPTGGLPSRSVKFYVWIDRHNHIHRSRRLGHLVTRAASELREYHARQNLSAV